jgi:hypothetical protein
MSTIIPNSDYDLWDAWLHKICPFLSVPLFFFCFHLLTLLTDKNTQRDNWFKAAEDSISTGVCLRVENGFFRVFPYENPALIPFETAIRALNPVVAVKVCSPAIHVTLGKM